MKEAKDFTHEERMKMIATAKKIGIKKAAKKFEISPEVMRYLRYNYMSRNAVKDTAKNAVKSNKSLEIENLILKEKIALLTEQANKLRSAVQTLA